jgi:hypothetical protein
MYSSFEGVALLNDYLSSREVMIDWAKKQKADWKSGNKKTIIERLSLSYYGEEANLIDIESSGEAIELPGQSHQKNFNSLSFIQEIDESIETEELLRNLLLCKLRGHSDRAFIFWLDKLIQRYEVSKKIYKSYMKILRVGHGKFDDVKIYWLFGVVLSMQYNDTNKIRYLSTLLKVIDLICSLPKEKLINEIGAARLFFLLSYERASILNLLEKKGVNSVNS